EQMPGVAFSPAVKYELARALSEIGVHIMDVGFPAVSASERETLRLVLEGRRRRELRPELEVLCMMRSNPADIDATMRVVDELGYPRDELSYFIFTSASDLHLKYKLGKTLLAREGIPDSEWLELPVAFYREANVRLLCDAIAYTRSEGARVIEFGGECASRVDVEVLRRVDAGRFARRGHGPS